MGGGSLVWTGAGGDSHVPPLSVSRATEGRTRLTGSGTSTVTVGHGFTVCTAPPAMMRIASSPYAAII
eukprot:CAMPEP_0185185698 /NCGR_PEP_ID=MMETSP1140-20130426/3500_1 /TAXON_ID=298111 /ORGANISM="Pavlova sp., Strain CCMP459" /LENGTH=67 /DNA_ID=CAMNT_0027751909 /DNA_START=26 /DNA_END=226 /DNA_ORIENTATION=+